MKRQRTVSLTLYEQYPSRSRNSSLNTLKDFREIFGNIILNERHDCLPLVEFLIITNVFRLLICRFPVRDLRSDSTVNCTMTWTTARIFNGVTTNYPG